MIKELTKHNISNDEKEIPLDGHNILELTSKQNDIDEKSKKKCCKWINLLITLIIISFLWNNMK